MLAFELGEVVRIAHHLSSAHGASEGALKPSMQRGYRRKRRTYASCKLTPDMIQCSTLLSYPALIVIIHTAHIRHSHSILIVSHNNATVRVFVRRKYERAGLVDHDRVVV